MKPENFPETPKELWNHFFEFTQRPRPSSGEEKVREYIESLAKKEGHEYKIDSVGNIIIYVPASSGYENHDSVVVQNHIDMVTDATPDRKINFMTDPIITYVDGDWLKADRTTLGADNGIGCSAALALMTDKSIKHPPLELLFTIDEETGLGGALGIDPSLVKSKKMLNLDTEEWGSLYIGCAGGINYEFENDIKFVQGDSSYSTYKVILGGLRGGHSGVDIHMQVGNAMKLMTEFLVESDKIPYEIAEIRSGRAHNIIPRDAYAIIRLSKKDLKSLQETAEVMTSRWKNYLPEEDRGLHLTIESFDDKKEVIDSETKEKLLSFLTIFPHGAHTYLRDSANPLVSLSNNLAIVLVMNGKWFTQSSLRFFDRQEAYALEHKMVQLGKSFKLNVKKEGEYPSWKPDLNNGLLEMVKAKYKEKFSHEPHVTAIHAGLECGVLRDKIGPIDAVSFGPTIMGAHSPQERVQISTVNQFWNFLVNVVESL